MPAELKSTDRGSVNPRHVGHVTLCEAQQQPGSAQVRRRSHPGGARRCLFKVQGSPSLRRLDALKIRVRRYDVVTSDEAIAGFVGCAFAGSDYFWTAVKSPDSPTDAASSLVPCEAAAHRCVVRYVELARDTLARTAERPEAVRQRAARLHIMQGDKHLSWDRNNEPLSDSERVAKYGQVYSRVEMLERILARRCAVADCDRHPRRGVRTIRLRLAAEVCCKNHRDLHEGACRRGVSELLAHVTRVIERSDRAGSEVRELPSGLPVQPLKRRSA